MKDVRSSSQLRSFSERKKKLLKLRSETVSPQKQAYSRLYNVKLDRYLYAEKVLKDVLKPWKDAQFKEKVSFSAKWSALPYCEIHSGVVCSQSSNLRDQVVVAGLLP